jgi:hypothetical protein
VLKFGVHTLLVPGTALRAIHVEQATQLPPSQFDWVSFGYHLLQEFVLVFQEFLAKQFTQAHALFQRHPCPSRRRLGSRLDGMRDIRWASYRTTAHNIRVVSYRRFRILF